MPRAVLDMMDRRPIWAMPEWVPEELRGALPPEWELVVIQEVTDGSGDGAARVAPGVLEAVSDAEVYFGYGIPEELLRVGERLRWVHSGAAGVGSSLTPTMKRSPVVFTNSAGIHAPPMAETVLGMLLHFVRGFDIAVAGQREHEWVNERYYVAGPCTRYTSGSSGGCALERRLGSLLRSPAGAVMIPRRQSPN